MALSGAHTSPMFSGGRDYERKARSALRFFFLRNFAQKKYKITKFARKKSSRKKVRAKKGPDVDSLAIEIRNKPVYN